ncbi:MAG: hypothetical protein MZV65_39690 [Chromatiales bacterium]|nr:hypothetical protein [Chromatiales bacterium]MCK7581159.1 hypothetical protein [Chromatiales bacterium]
MTDANSDNDIATKRMALANALAELMLASGLPCNQQVEAGWIAMQIVGGPLAAVVVEDYCAVSPTRSCR